MSKKRADRIWLGISIFSFLWLAISFLLMPLETEIPTQRLSPYSFAAGVMFWTGVIAGTVTQCILAHRTKARYKAQYYKTEQPPRRVGIFSFFQNRYAIAADVIALLSLAGFITTMIVTRGTGYSCYVCLSLFVFSFSMHCILNGKVFYSVTNRNKPVQSNKKDRVNVSRKRKG